jgi:AraC family transcriptional regulator
MHDRRVSTLVESPLLQVYDVRLRTPRGPYGSVDRSGVPQIIAPRRGVFGVERRGEYFVVDSVSVFFVDANDECRVSHPGFDGDDCTVVVPAPDLFDEWVTSIDGQLGRLLPRDQLLVHLITGALDDPAANQIEREEATGRLLEVLARGFLGHAWLAGRSHPRLRRRVDRARALLASAPGADWDLRTIGRSVDCSPYHLARQFRAATGDTLSGYLLRLRLNLALDRLHDGETNLSALALDLGFAQHSHFSARFRAAFGMTPAATRQLLTRARFDGLRGIVQPVG